MSAAPNPRARSAAAGRCREVEAVRALPLAIEATFEHLRAALRDLPGYCVDAEELLDAGW